MVDKLHFFSNFFTEFYVLHPYGEKAQDNLSKEDRTRALVYSILLGACSFGLVHLGCWVAERCFKPVDTTAENLKKQSSVAHQMMYKGGDQDPRKEDPTGYSVASGESKQKETKGLETQKTEEKKKELHSDPFTPWEGVPTNVKLSLASIFGNNKIIDRLPLFSVEECADGYDAELFNFPIMKGKICLSNGEFLPAIVIKVVPSYPNSYFERYMKDECQNAVEDVKSRDPAKTHDELYSICRQVILKEIETQPRVILLRKEDIDSDSKNYSWIEDCSDIEGDPNFFTGSGLSRLTHVKTGSVFALEKEIEAFRSLIAGGDALDLHHTQWKIFEYDRVQELLAK